MPTSSDFIVVRENAPLNTSLVLTANGNPTDVSGTIVVRFFKRGVSPHFYEASVGSGITSVTTATATILLSVTASNLLSVAGQFGSIQVVRTSGVGAILATIPVVYVETGASAYAGPTVNYDTVTTVIINGVTSSDVAIAASMAAHLAAPDPHPGYLTPAEGDAAYTAISLGNLLPTFVSGPVNPVASGPTVSSATIYYRPDSVASYDRYLSAIETGMGSKGTLIFVVATLNGDGTLTFVSSTTIDVDTGQTTKSGLDVLVPAGCVAGLGRVSGTWYYTAGTIPGGGTIWYTSAVPTTSTAKTIGTDNHPNFRMTFEGEATHKARYSRNRIASIETNVGAVTLTGWAEPLVTTGNNTAATYTVVFQKAMVAADRVARVKFSAHSNGTVIVGACSMAGNTPTTVKSVSVPVVTGINDINIDMAGLAGLYLSVTGPVKFQLNVNPDGIQAWTSASVPDGSTAFFSNSSHRYEFYLETRTGILADTNRLLNDTTSNNGMTLLKDADSTGVADATALFAAAVASHPAPYVKPGTFSLTAIPANESGLWGPGKINVSGRRYLIPPRPSTQALIKSLQQSLMEHANYGDVLAIVGDSIPHYYNATTGDKHSFNIFSKFLNFDIANDEPILTNLRPYSTYVPTFYGISYTGTVTTGTDGPIGECAILAAGAVMTFTGTYEQVDVFYTQESGAGTLDFKFNGGASFKTLSCAGTTDLDHYSGPTATGQAGSGTYTITASGGPVKITGLVRLGTKADPKRKRFITARYSHGSYQFTSFGAAQVISMNKQAAAFGGKVVPIIALGVNDSFTVDPSSIVTNQTALVNLFNSGSVPRIFGVPPIRPTSAWDASYTGGRTYDPAVAAIRRTYRQLNVPVLGVDSIDFNDMSAFSDGLHPNDVGHDAYAQKLAEALAAVGGMN